MTIPKIETMLPELTQFVTGLADERANAALDNWQAFIQRVRDFYTPAMMDKIEHVVPGWQAMSSYAEQQTLIHVTSVLTALHLLPEYKRATPEQQTLMVWMVLYHDVAKTVQPNTHDYIHGFRSAVVCGKGLARAGFPVTKAYADLIEGWSALTWDAVMFREDLQDMVQDNRKLPEIVAGIDDLFGRHTPAGLIIKGVLLHISIATDPDYPTVAPLTDDEIKRYVDSDFFPLLRMMLLVDADGWDLFDPTMRQHHRQQTLAVFDRIGNHIGLRTTTGH